MTSVENAAPIDQEGGPYFNLRVANVIEETADAKSFVFDVPQELAERFSYLSGQFLSFRIEVDGKRLVRCYSLASAPGIDAQHKVTVKRVVDGRASNWMNDQVKVGDTLEVMPPNGVFCLRDQQTPIVLFGGGSGVTPVISILKTALETTSRPIKLVYANRDDQSIIFKEELSKLHAANSDRLEVVHRLDDVHGYVDAAAIVQQIGSQMDADFYICGPGPFMDVVEAGLASLAIPAEQIFIERFESPDTPSGEVEANAADAADGNVVTIRLDGKETEISVADGETILAAARRVGLEPPFACEEAYCGCCMAKVTSGDVEMVMNDGGIDQRQIDEGWVLTCQGVAKGTARVEYPD
ncbi:MAG: 2Fe-2S iron-sulfur cluster-binding protein [Myxococcota bacterium]